jgi:hypothetical protein
VKNVIITVICRVIPNFNRHTPTTIQKRNLSIVVVVVVVVVVVDMIRDRPFLCGACGGAKALPVEAIDVTDTVALGTIVNRVLFSNLTQLQ